MPIGTSSQRALSRANTSGGRSYWDVSRAPRYSLLFALPLLIAYETLAALLAQRPGAAGIRNGADVMMKSIFVAVAGRYGPLIFALVLVGGSIYLIARDARRNRGPLRGRVFLAMLAESVVFALCFGVVVGTITARLLHALAPMMIAPQARFDVMTQLMVSLGAGLYEELLFRVVLVSALVALFRHVVGWPGWASGAAAVVLGALMFSAAHYVGQFGDRFTLQSFVFRAIGGLAFSALFVLRGFGITAWTHALYDVFLLAA